MQKKQSAEDIIIKLNVTCSHNDIAGKIAHLALKKTNHSHSDSTVEWRD